MKIGIKEDMDKMRFQEAKLFKELLKQIELVDRFHRNQSEYLEKKIELLEKQIKEKKNE